MVRLIPKSDIKWYDLRTIYNGVKSSSSKITTSGPGSLCKASTSLNNKNKYMLITQDHRSGLHNHSSRQYSTKNRS